MYTKISTIKEVFRMENELKFIITESHAYLRVPYNLLEDEKYTDYSLRDEEYAYLEEDYDALTFIYKHEIDDSKIKVGNLDNLTTTRCINS